MYIHEKHVYKFFGFLLPKIGRRVCEYYKFTYLYILYAIIYVFTELQTMVPKTAELA